MKKLTFVVLDTIRRYHMWLPQQTVSVAVSGGIDSIALLHVLAQTQRAHRANLQVIHVDHGLRAESVNECSFVQEQAEKLSLPFFSYKLELQAGSNLQERARKKRQHALIQVPADHIATAHHVNDQAETVLYRMLRGSGGSGLQGIKAVENPWCRPFFNVSKSDIYQWAVENKLVWKEDPSNPKSLRGAIRRLMPQLDEIHGNAAKSLARSARLLTYDEDLLVSLCALQWSRCFDGSGLIYAHLLDLHIALQLRLLRMLLIEVNCPIRADLLELFLIQKNKRIQFPLGYTLHLSDGRVLCEKEVSY